MADTAQTPEGVALALFHIIAHAEQKATGRHESGDRPDRNWVLDTFRDCLVAAKGQRTRRVPAVRRSG